MMRKYSLSIESVDSWELPISIALVVPAISYGEVPVKFLLEVHVDGQTTVNYHLCC